MCMYLVNVCTLKIVQSRDIKVLVNINNIKQYVFQLTHFYSFCSNSVYFICIIARNYSLLCLIYN